MRRNFILLDHSIEDSSGHYLEYARRILCAARDHGFRTVLGINKRAGNILCPEADLIDRAFSRTYWENQSLSPVGVLAILARNEGNVVGSRHFSKQFASEFVALTRRISANDGDIVFVPTLGGTELISIADYSRLGEARSLDWHLLFRRDLPNPKKIILGKAFIKHRQTITAFKEFSEKFVKGRSYYYTDTQELTVQYNRFASLCFQTLPIPVDDLVCVKKGGREGMPLIVSYLGDAREEKGFHLLPKLIKDVRAARFDENRVKFRIQANLPLAGDTKKAIRAKKELIDQERIGVGIEILEGPFDTAKYYELICSSDVILIPYCAKKYQARSSGIYAEALAAGVPTVIPCGTWMDKCKGESGSVGFKRSGDIDQALVNILSHYSEYKSRSIRYSNIWRKKHSAANLVESLITRATNLNMTHDKHNMRIGSL